ncbi:transcriptional regulator [Streptomyces sp. NPDC007901]|uniref:ParB/RepB/Spo0J family partition protein n=1 Tax=Streptomyces sp. NPDC007901 TaxID=3364785 RepID=UPI0036EB2679
MEVQRPETGTTFTIQEPAADVIVPARRRAGAWPQECVDVPIHLLAPGDSPRLNGCDEAHVARLAEVDAPLPPVLVHRQTMRVVDGMHRLAAAEARGDRTIAATFFDGDVADAFLHAVQSNIRHGLPLSQAERRAAAMRIIASHPHMSDRSIARVAGLGTKTVVALRQKSGGRQTTARVGRDGKVRPLDHTAGRLRAAELLTRHPEISVREVARTAGVSPATASDVRRRLARGEPPTTGAPRLQRSGPGPTSASLAPPQVLDKLLKDPSLRDKEAGRRLLRLLRNVAVDDQEWQDLLSTVPPHCATLVGELALQYAQTWSAFADSLADQSKSESLRMAAD